MTFCMLKMTIDNIGHICYNMTILIKGHIMKNRNIVKQGYQLVNARYKLSSNEMKFIMLVLAQIDIDDDNFKRYSLKVSDIDTRLNSGLGYTRLKKLTKDIMSKPFTIDTDFGFSTFNWFSSIHYYEKTGNFSVRIDDDLNPYLLDLKSRFVKYNLKYILPLSSNYSIRLYQLLKEYQKLTRRTFTVNELQDILQVPKSMKNYADFKRKVIQVAEKELINNCDIFFEYEEIKVGRKVNEILFRIKLNEPILENEKPSLFSPDPVKYQHLINKKIKMSTGDLKTITKIVPMGGQIKVIYENDDDNFSMLPIEDFESIAKMTKRTKK